MRSEGRLPIDMLQLQEGRAYTSAAAEIAALYVHCIDTALSLLYAVAPFVCMADGLPIGMPPGPPSIRQHALFSVTLHARQAITGHRVVWSTHPHPPHLLRCMGVHGVSRTQLLLAPTRRSSHVCVSPGCRIQLGTPPQRLRPQRWPGGTCRQRATPSRRHQGPS